MIIMTRQPHMVKNFAQNFFNSKLNLVVKFYEKLIIGTNFNEKIIWQ